MGLDIYLYHKGPDYELWKKKAELYDVQSEANYTALGGYGKMTEAQREEVSAKNDALIEEMGLSKYGCIPDEGEEKIEIDSKKYPENYNKIGYFRSSYNSGGMNSVLDDLGVPDLYEIFPHDDGEYNGIHQNSSFIGASVRKPFLFNITAELRVSQTMC